LRRGVWPTARPHLYFRGFYCWNSEVGAKTLGIASFYLRAVCQNRRWVRRGRTARCRGRVAKEAMYHLGPAGYGGPLVRSRWRKCAHPSFAQPWHCSSQRRQRLRAITPHLALHMSRYPERYGKTQWQSPPPFSWRQRPSYAWRFFAQKLAMNAAKYGALSVAEEHVETRDRIR
jgi:hypothetical protein